MWKRAIAMVVLVAISVGAGGVGGYYIGRVSAPPAAPATTYPVWTDQEVKNNAAGSGAYVPYLRCTFHQSDGSARVVEYPLQSRATCP